MNSYLTRTREGNARKEGKERTHTNTPGPERANPAKAREKKSGGRRAKPTDQRRGGRQKRLNQPNKAKPDAYLRTRRTQTYLNKGATREIGDPWGLVDETEPNQNLHGIQFHIT